MRIGELAKSAGCDVETVRYYEREGLLAPPVRTGANYRAYGPDHLARLRFIRRCRALDMELKEIRELLSLRDTPGADCGDVNRLLDEHLRHVSDRIRELTGLEKELRKIRRQCTRARATSECGILKELESSDAPAPKRGHLRGVHAPASARRRAAR